MSVENEGEVSVSLGSSVVEEKRIESVLALLLRAVRACVSRVTGATHGDVSVPKKVLIQRVSSTQLLDGFAGAVA